MNLNEIVAFWSQQAKDGQSGKWFHPDDRAVLAGQHSFNLDFPVSPYVGHIETAPIIILGANAGYSSDLTPTEFPSPESIQSYVQRVRDPENSDWSFVSRYYGGVNYGKLILDGKAALVNATPYRSPKISEEPDNRKLIERLPAVRFNRRWLLEAVLPLAQRGERLVVAKRPGLWKVPPHLKSSAGIVFDPAPVSPQITSTPWSEVQRFLSIKG